MPADDANLSSVYPVTLDAALDRPSRGLWIVKWLLLIPHFVVLAFLMVGAMIVWVAAFFAILFTGRYPRPLFDYTVGVMRWAWRVAAYGYGLAATDRYPPFTLAEVADYPAHLDVAYPERLSRGLVLVKWWLLAIPHYIITGLLYGGLIRITWQDGETRGGWEGAGIIGLLVLVALVVLLFRGTYPRGLFDLIVGLQRWGARVAGYALLLTDVYPPFRLDTGGSDPSAARPVLGNSTVSSLETSPSPPEQLAPPPDRWTPGRLVSLVVGALLVLAAGGLLLGAGSTALADRAARDSDGFVSTGPVAVSTGGHAVTTEAFPVSTGPDWSRPAEVLGTLRAQVTADDPQRPLFLGVAARGDVDRYLAGVPHAVITRVDDGRPGYEVITGSTVPAPPADETFWITQAQGSGTVEVTWSAEESSWVLVLARSDASAGVTGTAELGATLPVLGRLAAALAAVGGLFLVGGAVLMTLAFRQASGRGQPRTEVTVG